MERMALSHPEIAFKFINNRQTRLHTSGNHNLKDIIYGIYGRDIAANLLPVKAEGAFGRLDGFVGKPVISRGNRNFENYFVNGRYVKSKIITKAIEDAYKTFMMQHKYPFTALHFTIPGTFWMSTFIRPNWNCVFPIRKKSIRSYMILYGRHSHPEN